MSIYAVTWKALFDDTVAMRNIHHYSFVDGVASEAQLQELVDGVNAAYKTNLQTTLSPLYDTLPTEVRRVDIAGFPSGESNPTTGLWTGTNTADPMPPQICALVTWKAASIYPRTSRAYVGGFGEGNNTSSGRLGLGLVDLLEDFAADLLSISATGATAWAKVAVTYQADPRKTVDSNQLTSYTANAIWSQQKRRKFGVGI